MAKYEQIIETALDGVYEELAKHRTGSGTVSTTHQLEHFEQTLKGMLEDVRHGTFAPERTGMAQAVVDSWSWEHPLANRILAAVDAYSRAFGRKT